MTGGTGPAERLRPLAARCRGRRGSGHLLGCPGDSHQASQAWPLDDLADVVQRDDQFLASSGASFCLFSRTPRYSSGATARPGSSTCPLSARKQGLDRGVEGEGQRGELGGGEGTPAAVGLVDGLPAPGFAQVTAEGFAEVGQRQLPLRPQARDLPADGFLDSHHPS
ncbi:MAG TPA: hypothetical protein VFE59_02960, partial [Trebonia sp.]|nr:hypothetical protein [Trebonia sp.]